MGKPTVRLGPHRMPIDEYGAYDVVQAHRKEMLYRALNTRALVAFAGAGCSASLGYPSWQEFARLLIKRLQALSQKRRKEFPSDLNLTADEARTLARFLRSLKQEGDRSLVEILSATQKIFLRCFRTEYPAVLGGFFSNPKVGFKAGMNPYDDLLGIPVITRFITSNYDCEIDKAIFINRSLPQKEFLLPTRKAKGTQELGGEQIKPANHFRTFTQQDQDQLAKFVLAGLKDAENMVFHCHGHFGEPERMVVSEKDYRVQYLGDAQGKGRGFRQTLRLLFGSNPILFLGYGLGDHDLLRPLRMFIATDSDRKKPRPLFALMPLYEYRRIGQKKPEAKEYQDSQKDYFDFLYERYGVNVISFKVKFRPLHDDEGARAYGRELSTALKKLKSEWKEWWENWIEKPPFRSVRKERNDRQRARMSYFHYLPTNLSDENVELAQPWMKRNVERLRNEMKGGKKVIVLSGAGGVGKSWLAMNFLCQMQEEKGHEFKGCFFWSSYYADDSLTGIDRALEFLAILAGPDFVAKLGDEGRTRYEQLGKYLCKDRYLLVFDGIERFLREAQTPGRGVANSPGVKKFLEVISSQESKSLVILTTRLWPVALDAPTQPGEQPKCLPTVVDLPIHPVTSQDLSAATLLGDEKTRSELCFLLDGHIYALALAMGMLNKCEKGKRKQLLEQLNVDLGRTPSDRRTSRMIREALRAMGPREKIAGSLMERVSIFASPVRQEALECCWKDAKATLDDKTVFKLEGIVSELVSRHLLQKVKEEQESECSEREAVNKDQKRTKKGNVHEVAFGTHPMVREYFFGKFHHATFSQAPNLTLPGFTAAAADCHPVPAANDILVKGIYEALHVKAQEMLRPSSGGEDLNNQQGAIGLCRSIFSLVRSRMGVLTIPRWSDYSTYAQYLARLGDLTREIEPDMRWRFADGTTRTLYEHTHGPLYEDELAWLYNEIGLVSYAEGALVDALPTWDQAYVINRLIDGNGQPGYYTMQSLCNLGAANIEYGYLPLAEQYLRDGLEASRKLDDTDHEGRFQGYLGLVQQLRGNLSEAVEYYGRTLRLVRGHNPRATSIFLLQLAHVKRKQDKENEAKECVREARALAEAGRYFDLVAYARLSEGHLLRVETQYAKSLLAYKAALAEAKRIGIAKLESDALSELSRLALALGDGEVARQRAIESLDIANQLGLGLRKTHGLVVLGLATLKVGQRDLGIAYLRHARTLADQQEYWLRMREAEEELYKLGELQNMTRGANG